MGKDSISRRDLIRNSVVAGGGLAALVSSGKALAEACLATAPQGEGPFYPEGDLERDADLVQIQQGDPMAKGQVIFISGRVLDVDCRPIGGALVEIWQCCFSGKYNHSEDPNPLELDPNFQYWGRAHTDADGKYLFRTIVPGHYPNGPGIYRPPHVHFKAHAKLHQSLTTQMYFDPRGYDDPAVAAIVAKWNQYERVPQSLIVHFRPSPAGLDRGSKYGAFDITLKKIG